MRVRYATSQNEYQRMTTQELRDAFLLEGLFSPGRIELVYCEVERAIVGGAVPTNSPLRIGADQQILAADYFCQRREVGVLNIGGSGNATVDGVSYPIDNLDALYIGRGSREIAFESDDPSTPARLYIASYPAHAAHPNARAKKSEAKRIDLGSDECASKRNIYQYIHKDGVQSCQLLMGFTTLEPGSVWNTMPPHVHHRRTEVYLYFDVEEHERVFHLMGKEDEMRLLTVSREEAVISPMWSIHSGAGIRSYSFAWAMGGENQAFTDMQGIAVDELK